jgi:hypothetical protein
LERNKLQRLPRLERDKFSGLPRLVRDKQSGLKRDKSSGFSTCQFSVLEQGRIFRVVRFVRVPKEHVVRIVNGSIFMAGRGRRSQGWQGFQGRKGTSSQVAMVVKGHVVSVARVGEARVTVSGLPG